MLTKYEEEINHEAYEAHQRNIKKYQDSKEDEYFMIKLDELKSITGKNLKIGLSSSIDREVEIPVKCGRDGYFVEQVTGENIKILPPITIGSKTPVSCTIKVDSDDLELGFKDNGNEELIAPTRDFRENKYQTVPLRNSLVGAKGLEDGFYLKTTKENPLVKVSKQDAYIRFCRVFGNEKQRDTFIVSFIESAYQARESLKPIISELAQKTHKNALKEDEILNSTNYFNGGSSMFDIDFSKMMNSEREIFVTPEEKAEQPFFNATTKIIEAEEEQKSPVLMAGKKENSEQSIKAKSIKTASKKIISQITNIDFIAPVRKFKNLKLVKAKHKKTSSVVAFFENIKLNSKLKHAKHAKIEKTNIIMDIKSELLELKAKALEAKKTSSSTETISSKDSNEPHLLQPQKYVKPVIEEKAGVSLDNCNENKSFEIVPGIIVVKHFDPRAYSLTPFQPEQAVSISSKENSRGSLILMPNAS